MEIDLHYKTTKEAISFFIEKYNESIKIKYKNYLYVIHGYGSTGKGGKIKKSFQNFLRKNSYYLKYEFDSNPGATIVYPIKKLPDKFCFLESKILSYCSSNPKSLSKIETEFFKTASVTNIKKIVNSLVKQNKLIKIIKKNTNVYQTKGE